MTNTVQLKENAEKRKKKTVQKTVEVLNLKVPNV